MTEIYDEGGAEEFNRPRRPNPDTIAYLRSLPLDVQASLEEISSFLSADESSADYPHTLAAAISAIDEIKNEIASLAGDEFGSQCLEVLATIALPHSETAARTMMNGLAGYHLHLATHRYGSHVVQTTLQLSISTKTKDDLAMHKEGPQLTTAADLPTLTDLILAMVDELSPHASQLAVHVCGSHVLRSFICILGGVELQLGPGGGGGAPIHLLEGGALRRGRAKNKKKKKRKPNDASAAPPHAGMMHIEYKADSRIVASVLQDSLTSFMAALWGEHEQTNNTQAGPGELQAWACHPSAGPLLIISLRVLTFAFCPTKDVWQRKELDHSKSVADFRLGIVKPEPTFEIDSPAHLLAQQVLCWMPNESTQPHIGDVVYGMSGEPRGSHVLETLLRISHDDVFAHILQYGAFDSSMQEYVEHDVSNFVIQTLFTTVRTREQAEGLLKSVEKSITSGFVVNQDNKRRGVLWRAVEMASKFRVGQESLLKAIRIGMGLTYSKSEAEEQESETLSEEGKKKKRRQKASSIPLKECIPLLIDLKTPEREGDRIALDTAGTRTVYHLLRFVPRLCEDVLSGLTKKLAENELELLAKDGLGSRCIMDGILEGPMKEQVFSKAAKDLLEKLSGHWVALASDRVGHHTVKKVFRSLHDMTDKAQLATELAQGSNRLGGSSMGRSVMEACAIDQFMEGEESWREAVNKTAQKDEWLKEILEADHSAASGKSKRKRKRHKKEQKEGAPKKAKSVAEGIVDVISAAASLE